MADVKISGLPASTTPLAGTEVLPIVQGGATKQVSIANVTAGRDVSALSITTPTYKAANSAGGALQNASGVNQLQWGAGGGNNVSVDVAITINPANAAVAISPTGTGTVAISPAGALTINPTAASTINNTSIGATTALTGRFTSVTATTGNVVIGTSGQGIDFSATPDTGTSELLDDYEEGTWSPTLFGSTTAGTNTYLFATGRYTKTGRAVVLQFKIRIDTTASMAGNLRLGGLPFTAESGTDYDTAINIGEWGNLASSVNFMAGVIPQNQVYANLNSTAAASANLSGMSVAVFQAASYIIGSAVYVTAS
jgi:hypothetical protein